MTGLIQFMQVVGVYALLWLVVLYLYRAMGGDS